MSTPVKTDVGQETVAALTGLAMGDMEFLGEAVEMREASRQTTGLDARTFALVKIAALVALDSPPASTSGRSPTRSMPGRRPRTSSVCCAPWRPR